MNRILKAALIGGASAIALASPALADKFDIPGGDLASALDAFSQQTGVELIIADDALHGVHTRGAHGDLTATAALDSILSGTGFVTHNQSGAIGIVRGTKEHQNAARNTSQTRLASAEHAAAAVETIVVTSSKIKGDIQTVPIAITALSQEQLTSRQIAGGPDLVKEVPNLTFTKTNFTGYDIQIRGIGTQAISVTTDPAVAVAFNDTPFIRNHFFEQEFYDVAQVEVLRGPQGTLYGRNATAGVVNVISAKPTDHYEAMGSVDVGNYNNRRLEGMLNIPVSGDAIDLRVASEWTKRDGYAYNDVTDHQIDGRDLFSTRVSLLVRPFEQLTATAIWEHFQENDSRARSTKQLCSRSNAPAVVDGPAGPQLPVYTSLFGNNFGGAWLSQGCGPESLYSPNSFQTPNAGAIPFVVAFGALGIPFISVAHLVNPYSDQTQSHDLRRISSQIDPHYWAKNDTLELNVEYDVAAELTLVSQTGYNKDFLYSTEDFNRFNTTLDFLSDPGYSESFVGQDNEYCDPQVGCSSRFVAEDRSSESARQFYQELRASSNFKGPWNFLVGGNYMNYHTTEDYYIFSNLISLFQEDINNLFGGQEPSDAPHIPFDAMIANSCDPQTAVPGSVDSPLGLGCAYIDPNPIDKVDGKGHNYFLSHNPYKFNSWALFGETYYQVTPEVKLTGGLRYTDDVKNFENFPSWTILPGKGIPQQGTIRQEWREFTGRAVVDWTPKLDFTDQTMVYASYAHGYKGGGANPPGVTPLFWFGTNIGSASNLTHPVTFKAEFNDAFEAGTKNTLEDGAVVLDGDVFLYKYKNYQISQIVDRTAVNLNINATVLGAEIQSSWSPLPGFRLGFNGGYEDATIDDGQSAIDLMDRTAGHQGWLVAKPFVTATSNCVLPTDAVNEMMRVGTPGFYYSQAIVYACQYAYNYGYDPVTAAPYTANPDPVHLPGYAGFDPSTAPNGGQGFTKNIGGNQLPNAPHFTTTLTADFTMPLSENWAGTIHGDFYWQSQSWWRIFNDKTYDKLRGYSNVNLAVILTNSMAGRSWAM